MGESICRTYCTGCGLCHSVYDVEMERDQLGYLKPVNVEDHLEELKGICPAFGHASGLYSADAMWGKYKQVYLGASADATIRKEASSGGIITALSCYLLEQGIVDGIIHTVASEVYKTKTVVSRSREDVLRGMGSRYAISSPLFEIKQLVKAGEKYAFVGKPCDVSALRLYLERDEGMKEQIQYLFSFFCAGLPSDRAQLGLLKALKCSPEECDSLRYRGNGWPGYATAVKKDGSCEQISYNESWGAILGRDVNRICRFCLDGIGELADVSCGDAWYLTEDGKPDFTERDGRNVIFARTDIGAELIKAAVDGGAINVEEYSQCDRELKMIQRYQYDRRATMRSMIRGMRTCCKKAPKYKRSTLRGFAKKASNKLKTKRYLGTLKRALKGKI